MKWVYSCSLALLLVLGAHTQTTSETTDDPASSADPDTLADDPTTSTTVAPVTCQSCSSTADCLASGGGNTTEVCGSGICWSTFSWDVNATVNGGRGCLPYEFAPNGTYVGSDSTRVCTTETENTLCQEYGDNEVCFRCCSSSNCNDQVLERGSDSGAIAVTFHTSLLLAGALISYIGSCC